ncbi:MULTISPECIES: hypothetical protein [Bacillaceae]|uniref:Uncharacterized protein n=1 Tax=Evansella alkalicola TaxID=745819 RepID=A0ABS6JZJ8_9BACI|nr:MULTISPECIES: hypothetical protein [Bacillaceae]MBU9722520.1 hypothetical protein [Bacillus alkalicola]
MGHILSKVLLFSAILMLGFIFGVVYSNHVGGSSSDQWTEGNRTSGNTVSTVEDVDDKTEDLRESQEEASSIYPGFILKTNEESNSNQKAEESELKIEMEDEEHRVVYDQEMESIRNDLLKDIDVQRDLLEKQRHVNHTGGLFSEMGIKTTDAFEGVFKRLFSMVSR